MDEEDGDNGGGWRWMKRMEMNGLGLRLELGFRDRF